MKRAVRSSQHSTLQPHQEAVQERIISYSFNTNYTSLQLNCAISAVNIPGLADGYRISTFTLAGRLQILRKLRRHGKREKFCNAPYAPFCNAPYRFCSSDASGLIEKSSPFLMLCPKVLSKKAFYDLL